MSSPKGGEPRFCSNTGLLTLLPNDTWADSDVPVIVRCCSDHNAKTLPALPITTLDRIKGSQLQAMVKTIAHLDEGLDELIRYSHNGKDGLPRLACNLVAMRGGFEIGCKPVRAFLEDELKYRWKKLKVAEEVLQDHIDMAAVLRKARNDGCIGNRKHVERYEHKRDTLESMRLLQKKVCDVLQDALTAMAAEATRPTREYELIHRKGRLPR